jgi:hypothetical protein
MPLRAGAEGIAEGIAAGIAAGRGGSRWVAVGRGGNQVSPDENRRENPRRALPPLSASGG